MSPEQVAALILLAAVVGAFAGIERTDFLKRRRAQLDQDHWIERHREIEAQAIRERVRIMEANREMVDYQADAALRVRRTVEEGDEPWRGGR